MKADDLKTAAGFEPIKTKALQLPLDILEVKASLRANITPDAFETSTPSLYALRFFSSSTASETVRSRLSRNRISQQSNDSHKEKTDIQLSPVELTINKKIKFPHDKKRQFGREKPQQVELTSSDREIIEELRHQLRTQPRNGTTSVLEAIGDPEVREQRFYYEPLNTFLQSKESANKYYPSDSGLRVVDIMIPTLEKGLHPDNGDVLPLTLSRHNAAVTRNANRFRSGGTVTYLPKVEGSSLMRSQNTVKFFQPEMPSQSREPHIVTKRKTQFILPRIGLKRDEYDYEENAIYKRRKGIVTVGESRAKAATVQLPPGMEDDNFRNFNGFPRRATTTATGKSHLVGPMNKMDIIADYSKALQNGLISYNEYMKKLSVLSLHKVPLGKSMQRHFHLVRDGTTNMKPKLAHVDVTSGSAPQISSESSEHSDGNKPQAAESREKSKTSQSVHFGPVKTKAIPESSDLSNKQLQSQLHRVDIGEGLSLFEKPKQGPEISDELIVPDLTRYSHVHHPRPGRQPQYHWNHESVFSSGSETWSNKHWPSSVTAKIPNKIHSSLRNIEATKDEKDDKQSKTKVLLSMEEYLKMHTPQSSIDLTSKSRQKNDVLGGARFEETPTAVPSSDVVNLAEENFDYIGKLPEPVSDQEPVGLGTREILRSVNFKLPANSVSKEDINQEEPSDIDSVFQEHLDNMLKTIKKSKVSSKKKVPELRGLVPTVIPQVLVEDQNPEENVSSKIDERKKQYETSSHLLGVREILPKNSPPPTAGELTQPEKNTQQSTISEAKTEDKKHSKLTADFEIPTTSIEIVTERRNSQPERNNDGSQPKTPHSVQSHRSTGLVVPTVVLEEAPHSLANNSEVRVMTASVDLIVPSSDDGMDGASTDRSRLEVTITSMPVAPPASVATSSDGSIADDSGVD